MSEDVREALSRTLCSVSSNLPKEGDNNEASVPRSAPCVGLITEHSVGERMNERRNLASYYGMCSAYDPLDCYSERLGMFSAWNESVGPYLPGLDGFLEACFEASPSFHIIRIDTTRLERFNRTAYLLRPEFV